VDDAFDTIKNQRVRAESASDTDFPSRYICPLCQTEVVYASGPFVSSHFRHRRGTDHEECERYCKNFQTQVPLSHHEYEHLDAVLVAKQSPAGDKTFVSFAVRFRPAYAVDFVHFVSGTTSIPYTIHSNLRQQYFRITTPEENYIVKATRPGAPHEVHIVEGFGERAAIFRASEREAVRIPNHRLLKPGEYVVISKKFLQPHFDVPLEARSLKTIPGLHATFIRIPEDPSWRVRENLRSLLQFETASRVADYAFLTPMDVSELAPDCWEAGQDADVAILIRLSKHLSPRPSRLLVQKRVTGHLSSDYLPLSTNLDDCVIQAKPGSQRPDLYRIGLADPIRFLFEISFTAELSEPQCARITFQFSSKSKTRPRLTWTSHELPTALMDASRGSATLLSITKPKSVQIGLSDRSGQRIMIPETSPVQKLLSFLQRAHFPCVLSATGYPNVTLRREKPVSQRLMAPMHTPDAAPRSRHHARLLGAFNRGRVSPYSIRSIAL